MAEDESRTVGGRVLAPEDGRTVRVPSAGGQVTMKAESKDTGSAVTVFENVLRPHAPGPARHFHRTWTELFYVLEGEMLFEVNGMVRSAPHGTFVSVPPGAVHAFCNPSDDQAKLLIMFVPGGGFEGFFEAGKDLGSPMTDAVAWQEINVQWDIQVVGPPLERARLTIFALSSPASSRGTIDRESELASEALDNECLQAAWAWSGE